MADYQGQGIQSLIGDALRETSDLARKEMMLFKAELSDNVKTLLIGVGMIGEDHVRRLTRVVSGATVTALTDVDVGRAKRVAADHGHPAVHNAGRDVIDSKHHADATELDTGGYCNDGQAENIVKKYSIPIDGFSIDVYFGKFQTETPKDIEQPMAAFLPLLLSLTKTFGVDPSAVNIFLDGRSNTVAFNLSGALFFNLAWFMELHWAAWETGDGRSRAWDAWYLTYCHELAHNLVKDHNARHQWYQQQIAVEFARGFRAQLARQMGVA